MKIKIRTQMLNNKGMIYERGFNIIRTFVNDYKLWFIFFNIYHNLIILSSLILVFLVFKKIIY
jgi:hypothetical protein